MQTLLLAAITFVIIIGTFYMMTLFSHYRDEEAELIESAFAKDLERTKNAIRFCNQLKDADRLIDSFEERWKGRVDLSYLHNAIGKLIETQFSNEINYQS